MLPELGLFCLILALCLSVLQCGIFCSRLSALNIMRPIALGQSFFICIAFIILLYCFVGDDFSVRYVAANSNSSLPIYYKITAIWGAHEGSLLLWILLLNGWCLAVLCAARKWQLQFCNATLLSFALINIGFLSLMLWTSNPFARTLPDMPLDGADLNPLLQDFGMILHPPILYLGYVGCTVAFALAIAALLTGKLDQTWARMAQPWVLLAWMFLTLGIALGSWWAYYELGWGGWWFWDPVENASFMPWLTATALLHCLAIARKNGQLLLLALFLAIVTFALSLLGTFLVRSGSIISVHAFVADPQRGAFILQFLTITIGGALFLYATRVNKIILPNESYGALTKSATLILANNIVLLVAASTVLLGTLYPLAYEAVCGDKITVGYPYFNAVFVPIMLILFAIMLPGIITNKKTLVFTLLGSGAIAVLFITLWFGIPKLNACLGLAVALAIILSCYKANSIAMFIAHLGLAISIVGISLTPAYEIEKDLSMHIGDAMQIATYNIKFAAIKQIEGANYVGFRGDFIVSKSSKNIVTLHPEKRMYLTRETIMTETAILPGVLQDIYIALGQELEQNIWSTRIYYKPFVRWIWLGALIMALGAAIAVFKVATAKKQV